MRYSIVLIAILTVACGRQFKPEGYRLLSPNKTNITFNNEIVETDSLNPLEHFYIYNGAGVGIGDINNDGLPDIFFAGNLVSCRLYLNQGNMQFTDITEQAGVDTKVWCTGVSMVDLNADGLLDIYVSVADKEYSDKGRNLLFINQGNNEFVEQAAAYGLDDPGYSTQAVFFDYDGDEDLDAYLLTNGIENKNHNDLRPRKLKGEGITTDRLYRNNGDLTFTNVSEAAGITAEGYGLGVGVMDVNNDGWPDIYCANDFITNDLLWINHGDGTFTDSLSAYFSQVSHNGMGMDIADFNNDGLTDLVEMDMLPETNKHHKTMTPAMNYNSQLLRYRFGYSPQ
ncbi:MAG: VCBS repeat-containing protein, partial [Cytophagales bacterium]|nr:VCBS repeat-containing protein [Cytophagales bacterium]